ncbi:pantoate--beta-alanine ligase [Sporomusa sp. KB1]|jgi:pantoate--beta-alanine ligase|uniref:pantoate--beta-alanine ligase n=1 Tax=Sporomusa sp. KB1 TaxID=943346 RepID=UPI00119F6743|nr:pantoate--beta-alanine ligase [Sporomusa sp. KB1]TWH46030.1 pantoate--beta-alanine ligase [Sporomusa sp. KB1]
MRVIETIQEMRAFVSAARRQGKSIALVPTMGALHEGHLTLMRRAKAQCDIVITSIFVNPTQFGPQEDLACYPRDLTGDSEKANGVGVDAIFHPTAAEMYPNRYASYVHVEKITAKLCGLSRPGHFRGVTTVVSKLFNIVQPDKAFFGQKDAQQVLVIDQMVRDLNMNVQLEMVPIVREDDGLAMSSRNRYLSTEERSAAMVLSQSLSLAQQLVHDGERDIAKIRTAVVSVITEQPLASLDYVEIYNYPELESVSTLSTKALLALAVRFGTTRLIDNTILEAT